MKRVALAVSALLMTDPALPASLPELNSALAKWSAPVSISRFQYALVDLNGDGTLDAVVHVTDPDSCKNGGCPLVVFKGTPDGYEMVANSGLVRKPIYVLEEVQLGWRTLSAIVGLGNGERLVPVRFNGVMYNPTPYMRGQVHLTSEKTRSELNFREVP